jgi:cardiolipin synthase
VRNLTLANQMTMLRIALIPAFVLFEIYGQLGAGLLVFMVAGLTDALDGLIARRTGQRTSLGAWLDPMADKLLLLSTFIVLTIPSMPFVNHLPVWLTVVVISRDVVIVGVVAVVTFGIWVSLALTLVSSADYFVRMRKLIGGSEGPAARSG